MGRGVERSQEASGLSEEEEMSEPCPICDGYSHHVCKHTWMEKLREWRRQQAEDDRRRQARRGK